MSRLNEKVPRRGGSARGTGAAIVPGMVAQSVRLGPSRLSAVAA